MVHDQLELTEVSPPEDVGDGLAPHATPHHVVERERRIHVESLFRIRVKRGAVHPNDGSEHHLRIEARRVDAGRLERLGRLIERGAQG